MDVDWERLKRIYVRLPNWVGDVVLATPMLAALRRAAPKAEILAHGKAFQLEVLSSEPLFDRTLTFQRHKSPLWPFLEGRRVTQEWGRPDLCFLLPNSVSSAFVAQATGAPVRVGYSLGGRGPLLTHGIPVKRAGLLRPIPMVDYYLRMLTHLGASVDGIPRRPSLTITDDAAAEAERFLTRLGLNGRGNRLWAINIGGSWETKRWIPAYAGRLANLLQQGGLTPLLLRGPGEGDLAREVCREAGWQIPGVDDVVPLTELTALLARCEMLVTTDSGPRHFGIAAGIPVTVIVGPTHPGYTRVDYRALEVVCAKVACWPCHLKHCPVDFRCMRALTPERVLERARGLLGDRVRERILVGPS